MHRRQAGRVAQLRLSYGEVEHDVALLRRPSQPDRDLTEQVCDPLASVSSTDIDDPLRQDGRIDRAVPPERLPNGRITSRGGPEGRVGDAQDRGHGKRLER